MSLIQEFVAIALIGIGATIVMDLWLILLRRVGIQTQSFALVGRWVGHLWRGHLSHPAIAKSPPIKGEMALGWVTHYAVGIAFAAVLLGLAGPGWQTAPTVLPALLFGIGSVIAPLFVMQPAMGAGFAASKTPAPLKSCLRSLATHTVFGLGLYLAARLLAAIGA